MEHTENYKKKICNNNNLICKKCLKAAAVKWLIIYDLKVYRRDIILARAYYIAYIIKTQFRVNYNIIMYTYIVAKHVRRL